MAEADEKNVENLKIALKAANDSLLQERQQKLKDRKTYEAKVHEVKIKYKQIYVEKVHEIEKYCNEKFEDLNEEHEAKIKSMEKDHEKSLKMLRQPPSQPSLCDQSQQTLSQELINQSQQTAPGNLDHLIQTFAIPTADLSSQTEFSEEKLVPDSSEVAAVVAMQAQVEQLMKEVAELVYENNGYHLAISNCTFCASDSADISDASSTYSDASIRDSTLASSELPSSGLDPALSSSTIPALMSLRTKDRRQTKTDTATVKKSKDQTFITRMVKTLSKLETKYQTPEHKRKKRLFVRKQKTSPIVPKEFATIYNVLAAREPDTVSVPDPFPQVRWNDVRFKPALPNPEPCPVHSCSPDPEFYVDRDNLISRAKRDFNYFSSQYSNPFGTLPGYKTSLGVVAVPTTPVGGYVYCPDAKKWVLFAEPHSSPASAGRGTRRGGGTPFTRRRKG